MHVLQDEEGDKANLSASTIRELRGEACRLLDPLFRRFVHSPEHNELAAKLRVVQEPMPWVAAADPAAASYGQQVP